MLKNLKKKIYFLLAVSTIIQSNEFITRIKTYLPTLNSFYEQKTLNTNIALKSFPTLSPYVYNYIAPYSKEYCTQKGGSIQVGVKAYEAKTGRNNDDRLALPYVIFGKDTITVADIHLISKLAYEDKLSLPGGGFGADIGEQYIACLAPTQILFDGQLKKISCGFDGVYKFDISNSKWSGLAGIHIPLKQIRHHLWFLIRDGSLSCSVPEIFTGENNVDQYFHEFNLDFSDYFLDSLLEPKKITFKPYHEKFGLGDISLFTTYLWQPYPQSNTKAQLGLNLTLPTSAKATNNILWDIQMGKGGSIEWYGSFEYSFDRLNFLNPFLYSALSISFPRHYFLRIPILKNNIDQLIIPDRFIAHSIDEFSEFDTTTIGFSDETHLSSVNAGQRLIILIGNRWNNIFDSPFNLAISYRYFYRSKGSIKVLEQGIFNTNLLEENNLKKQHTLQWNIQMFNTKRLTINFGMQHMVSGINTPRYNKFIVSMSGNF